MEAGFKPLLLPHYIKHTLNRTHKIRDTEHQNCNALIVAWPILWMRMTCIALSDQSCMQKAICHLQLIVSKYRYSLPDVASVDLQSKRCSLFILARMDLLLAPIVQLFEMHFSSCTLTKLNPHLGTRKTRHELGFKCIFKRRPLCDSLGCAKSHKRSLTGSNNVA